MSQEIDETVSAPEHPFIRLLTNHQDKISRAVGLMAGDPELANDIAQDAFYTALQKFDQLENEEKFISWILKIAQNIYYNAYRNKKREQQNLRDFYDSQKSHVLHIAKIQNPSNEAQLNDEVEAVQRKIETLPEKLRVVFGLYCRDGFSVETIASMLDVSISTVRKRIAKVRQRFNDRNEYMAIAFLTTSATLAPFQEMILQFRRLAMETAKTGDLLATANSGSPETTAAGASAGSLITQIIWTVLSLPLLTILWVVSLFLGGQVCGTAFVRNAPSAQARRWIVKQLLICYGWAIGFLPLMMVIILCLTKIWGREKINTAGAISLSVITVLVASNIVWMNRTYRRICKNPALFSMTQRQLQGFVRWGYILLSVVLAGSILTIIYDLAISASRMCWESHHSRLMKEMAIFITSIVAVCLVHINAYSYFRYLIRISREEYTTPVLSRQGSWKSEVAYLLPFAMFNIMPQIIHLVAIRTFILVPAVLSFIFSICWGAVLYRNIKFRRYRWRYILGTFVAQLFLIVVLKTLIGMR